MLRRIRRFAAIAIAAVVIAFPVAPASAALEDIDPQATPPIFDLFVLRPIGLLGLVGGTMAFVPAAALTGIFAPRDIDKPFDFFVRTPFVYTFVDRLGTH